MLRFLQKKKTLLPLNPPNASTAHRYPGKAPLKALEETLGTALTVWVGSAAAFLTTISFVPQALHVVRTKHTHGISLPMYVLFTVGIALWLIYGVLIVSWPVIIANTITFFLASIILLTTIRNRRHTLD